MESSGHRQKERRGPFGGFNRKSQRHEIGERRRHHPQVASGNYRCGAKSFPRTNLVVYSAVMVRWGGGPNCVISITTPFLSRTTSVICASLRTLNIFPRDVSEVLITPPHIFT